MKLSYAILQTIVQAFLAQVFLIAFNIYTTMNLATGISTSLLLFFFLSMYQIALSLLFLALRIGRSARMFIIPLISSLLVSLTLTLYPSLGFTVDFWALVLILFFSGIVSFLLLRSAGASWGETHD